MSRFLVLSLALVLFVGAALAADDAATYKTKAEPIAANYFDALKAGEFVRMTRDFDATMKAKLPPVQFKKMCGEAAKVFGVFVSAAYDRVEIEGGCAIVYYHATYAKATTEVKFVFAQADPAFKLAGLWEKPVPKAAAPDETTALRAKVDPVIARFLAAFKAKKYIDMTADFTDEMKKGLGPDKLRQTFETGLASYGAYLSAAFDCVESEGSFASVYYRATFEKGAPLWFKFVFKKDDPARQIGGLWLRPSGCGGK